MSTVVPPASRPLLKRLTADASIAWKISACLGALLLVSIGLTGLAVQRMGQLSADQSILYERTSIPMTQLNALTRDFGTVRARTMVVPALFGDALTAQVNEPNGRYTALVAEVEAYRPKASSAQTFDAIKTTVASYTGTVGKQVIDLQVAGDTPGSTKAATGPLLDAAKAVNDALAAESAALAAEAEGPDEAGDASVASSVRLMWTVLAVTALLCRA